MQFKEIESGIEKESSEKDAERHIELKLPSDDETSPDTLEPTMPRRSERERRPPTYYGEWANISNHQEPLTFGQVLCSPNKSHWMEAMKKLNRINSRE